MTPHRSIFVHLILKEFIEWKIVDGKIYLNNLSMPIYMSGAIPSARELVKEVLSENPNLDVNALHQRTYELMIHYRSRYYESRVDAFLSRLTLSNLPSNIKRKLKKEMLKPIIVGNKEYSNFMEEASRRISQSFQPLSGKIAELAAQRELDRVNLEENVHYTIRKARTDITVYHPNVNSSRARHRVEVKNVKLRERGARGLGFDGDSLFGFFEDASEFSRGNVEVIDNLCQQTNGYCYVPPSTLAEMSYRGTRFRPNTQFGKDMLFFVQNGRMP
jgi:hypothetical protein